jgi:hypothetical protein
LSLSRDVDLVLADGDDEMTEAELGRLNDALELGFEAKPLAAGYGGSNRGPSSSASMITIVSRRSGGGTTSRDRCLVDGASRGEPVAGVGRIRPLRQPARIDPDAGARFHRRRVPGVRRLVMLRTKHHVYYLHDERNAVVVIIAVWGAPRAGVPLLIDQHR